MNKAHYVSIIIVAYNYGKWLPRTLEACKNQTFTDFELILVNNGSTDNTQEIMDAFIIDNPQLDIKLAHIEVNDGLANGRNTGIRNATGTYLLFNDADDWMDSNCLELLAAASENGKYDCVHGQYRDVATDGKILQIRNYPKNMSKWYITMFHASLFKREIFVQNNITSADIGYEDYYVSVIFHSLCSNYKIVQNTVYNYFINEYSSSGARGYYSREKITNRFAEMCSINHSIKNRLTLDEQMELQYQLVRSFLFEILHYCRYSDYKHLLETYQQLHQIMIKNEPDYLRNKKITLFKNNGSRFYGRAITFILCQAERLHLMKGLLYLYNCLSKHIFFRV